MGVLETLIIYGSVGASVAAALWLQRQRVGAGSRTTSALELPLHVVLWPLFAPSLVADGVPNEHPTKYRQSTTSTSPRHDERLEEIEAPLLLALRELDGTPEDVLKPELERVQSLFDSLDKLVGRRDDMSRMLNEVPFRKEDAERMLDERHEDAEADQAQVERLERRIGRIERLESMHAGLSSDIRRTMLELEDMTSQIRLLKFADRPQEEVRDMIRDITCVVDGLTEGMMAQ